MADDKMKSKLTRKPETACATERLYESEAMVLQSLRLIAAPDPKDDLSDEELKVIHKGQARSSALIHQLIDCIKAI